MICTANPSILTFGIKFIAAIVVQYKHVHNVCVHENMSSRHEKQYNFKVMTLWPCYLEIRLVLIVSKNQSSTRLSPTTVVKDGCKNKKKHHPCLAD